MRGLRNAGEALTGLDGEVMTEGREALVEIIKLSVNNLLCLKVNWS